MTDELYFQVLRGKLKGQILKVNQICNDWVTADTLEGARANRGQPLSPVSTYFDVPNRFRLVEMEKKKQLGQMFRLYYDIEYFMTTGKFRRIKL